MFTNTYMCIFTCPTHILHVYLSLVPLCTCICNCFTPTHTPATLKRVRRRKTGGVCRRTHTARAFRGQQSMCALRIHPPHLVSRNRKPTKILGREGAALACKKHTIPVQAGEGTAAVYFQQNTDTAGAVSPCTGKYQATHG